jgi:galactokinase
MGGKMQTQAERMAMIRQAAKKFQASQTKQAGFRRKEKEQLREDERYWTDAPKYAQKYYGEVYRETTRFDNDWD